MINFRKLTLGVAVLALFQGCASIPTDLSLPAESEIVDQATQDWALTPAVVEARARSGITVTQPNRLPAAIANSPIEITLEPGTTIGDFIAMLGNMSVPVTSASSEILARQLFIPSYKGTLGELLEVIGDTNELAVEWRSGFVVFGESARYQITLPQDEALLSGVRTGIESIGASDVSVSQGAGLISYRATPETQRAIEPYIQRISQNAGLVDLQVAVINVSLNRERHQGLNWNTFALRLGDAPIGPGPGIPDPGGAPAIPGAPGPQEPALEAGDDPFDFGPTLSELENGESPDPGNGGVIEDSIRTATALLSSGGLSASVVRDQFSLSGMINMLSTYGSAQTMQNVNLKSLSGLPVRLRSGQSVPYVGDVGVSSVSDSLNTSSTRTDTVETGLTIEMTPFFDAESELVTVDLDLELKSLLGFVELSAGREVGSISQPNTQDQSFNSLVRIRAGDTVILGGIVYDQISDNRSSLAGLDRFRTASQNRNVNKNALFIVMRPSVTIYRDMLVDERVVRP
ncbi:type II secretion system protein GspD [Thioalkalivibrio thiocyanodenitrificans]|uniref:type II secretion system protein GspD n=1 Tax=Thioalkalivibrio thiocyanodenitrificans TaxID=243063 RepID=UPI00035DB66B|nr:hypothetical protein [Thioalkalivibrio thiocyanodenitrificans]